MPRSQTAMLSSRRRCSSAVYEISGFRILGRSGRVAGAAVAGREVAGMAAPATHDADAALRNRRRSNVGVLHVLKIELSCEYKRLCHAFDSFTTYDFTSSRMPYKYSMQWVIRSCSSFICSSCGSLSTSSTSLNSSILIALPRICRSVAATCRAVLLR